MLLLVLLAPLCAAQEPAPGLEDARARWEHMSPAERARIAQRFNEYRVLPDEDRERMMSHMRRVADARREIEARIPAELKAKLEQLSPEDRHQVLREYVESTMGERAGRLREKLSPELLAKLQNATADEREELLRAGRDEWRERGASRALEYLRGKLELPPEEVARLQALPPDARLRAIGELGQREMERRGPPPGVDPQEFRRWLELTPPEFMERMHGRGMRGFRPEDGPHPEFRPGERGPRGEFGRTDGRPEGSSHDGQGRSEGRNGDRGPRPGPPDGPQRGPRREGKITQDARSRVMRAMRPDSQWIIELATEPREVRRQEIFKRSRARVVGLLRLEPGISAEEIACLEALEGREFMEALREIAGDPPMSGPGEWRHRDRPRNEPPPPRGN